MGAAFELTRQIDHLLDVERVEEARRALSQPLSESPDSAELLFLAARVETVAGSYEEAERLLHDVLAHAPEHDGARYLRSELFRASKRYPEAEAELLGLLRDEPASATLHAMYAQVMFETLHVEKAQALVDEALR